MSPGDFRVQTQAVAAEGALASSSEFPCVSGYQIKEELGRGGMGIVYLARQSLPARFVALKVISAGPFANEQALARFRREAAIIGQLQHANIVPIYEVGSHHGRPYFTMEYLNGGNLAQRLSKQPIAARPAAQLVETLARAMQAAHERGFVHRDLKPSNILLADDGTPKVSDFGLAKQLVAETEMSAGDLTESGAMLGTPNYMAPEQASGKSSAQQWRNPSAGLGSAVDVYGLGAILYECLTGQPPFRAASVLETLDMVRSQEPTPPKQYQPSLPRDLQTICLKCLEKNPLKRYASAHDLAYDLRRFQTGEPILAVPVSAFGRFVKWSRRRPAWAALWGLVLAMIVVSFGAVAYHTTQLHNSLIELSTKETQVRQAKEQSDANYQAARKTIHQMLDRSEERILKSTIPQVRELMAQQAEDALQFFRTVAARSSDPDPGLQYEVAEALGLVGRHRGLLGDRSQAVNLLREGLQVAQALAASDPSSAQVQLLLGEMHLYLAENLPVQRDGEAEKHYLEAREILDAVSEHPPNGRNMDVDKAYCRHQLGILYRQTGRLPLAEEQLRQALHFWQIATAKPKTVPPILMNRKADSHISLGLILYQKEQFPASQMEYIEAEKCCLEAARQLPEDLDVVATLGTIYLDWGLLYEAKGENDEALRRWKVSIDLLEHALQREPNMVRLRTPARNAHGARGRLSGQLEHYAQQAEDLRRDMELSPGRPSAGIREQEATALARSGDHVRAMSAVERLVSAPPAKLEWNDYQELAAAAVFSSTAAGRDPKLASTERSDLAERYATRAVQLLEKAVACVDAKNADDLRKGLKSDKRWATLRNRPDFPKE